MSQDQCSSKNQSKVGKQHNLHLGFRQKIQKNYSMNELEILTVKWAIKNVRNYVYRTEFEVVSNHMALRIILVETRSNTTFSSRLT